MSIRFSRAELSPVWRFSTSAPTPECAHCEGASRLLRRAKTAQCLQGRGRVCGGGVAVDPNCDADVSVLRNPRASATGSSRPSAVIVCDATAWLFHQRHVGPVYAQKLPPTLRSGVTGRRGKAGARPPSNYASADASQWRDRTACQRSCIVMRPKTSSELVNTLASDEWSVVGNRDIAHTTRGARVRSRVAIESPTGVRNRRTAVVGSQSTNSVCVRPELSHRNRLTIDPFGSEEVLWDGTAPVPPCYHAAKADPTFANATAWQAAPM